MPIFGLPEEHIIFPDPKLAEPDGLIAVGGDLSPNRLVEAYLQGFFPWYNEGEQILWWHPLERMVLFPSELKVAKSMRPYFNQNKFELRFDTNFEEVILQCAKTQRKGQEGTWISKEMIEAYSILHQYGIAHSVEAYENGKLVGGLYGLALGRVFYGESMFSLKPNASKFAFISLVRILKANDFYLVDCQQETDHLASMGARPISQERFLDCLSRNRDWIKENDHVFRFNQA